MRVVTGTRSGRCGLPFTRPLVASRGALLPPSLLALGTASSSPMGEAVIMKDALRAIPFSGHFVEVSLRLIQQRRAVRGTVCEERAMQPVMRSLRRIMGVHVSTAQEERSGRRCERNGPEGVEPSTVDRQQSPENRAPARSPPVTEGISPSRGATSGQRARITEWVGRRPRLQLAGSELSRAGRRAAVAGPAGEYQNRNMKGRLCTIQPGRGRSEYYSNA